MKNVAKYFGAAFGLAFGLSSAALSNAAKGDQIYPYTMEAKGITAVEAATLTDCFIAVGAWDADRLDTKGCRFYPGTTPGGEDTPVASCKGTKTSAPKDVPIGSRVVGWVE